MGEATARTDGAPDGITVALVDDHAFFRSGLRDLLTEHGFAIVGEAASGEEAVELIAETAPDVAVMDVNMPGIGGIQATRRISVSSPTCRVLMLTVSPDDSDVNEAILAGACGYVLKDASGREIVSAVNAAARGESLLSPPIATKLLERIRDVDDAGQPDGAGPPLTERELDVLRLIAQGKSNGEIADELVISVQMVKNHVSNLLAKLHVENRIQAAVVAVRRHLA